MAKSKGRQLAPEEQHVLEHAQLGLLTTPKDIARGDQLIVEHHYLHDATLVGEQLRYAITYQGRGHGVATWSGAALHIKDRDAFIGWDFEQCRRRRSPLAHNSRLLILPDCHHPNLISRFMKLMLARLSDDWLERWGHPLAMVETFVDPRLYQGPAYKVSGGSHLGKTAGWKRDAADFYLKHAAPKQIWVRELVKHAAVKLRAEQCLEGTPNQAGFPGVRLVARLETRVKRAGQWSRQVVFLVSSLTLEELAAAGLLRRKRSYWVIESRLHHGLDITQGEDSSRVRTPNSALVLGMIRRGGLSLANAAVDGARQANPKTKFGTKKFQQGLRSARGGRERLHALIYAKCPAVLDLGKSKGACYESAAVMIPALRGSLLSLSLPRNEPTPFSLSGRCRNRVFRHGSHG